MPGVAGIVYDPRTLQPLPGELGDLTFVSYSDPRLRWTLAARSLISLHGCTTVDLEELAATAAPQTAVRRPGGPDPDRRTAHDRAGLRASP
ncbi:hypothetical protein [Streptomyces peucetius]|nr:hypothetical protein CGZ69_28015 [Streptomyces peucetius subsp. caesius ATCC 27952]